MFSGKTVESMDILYRQTWHPSSSLRWETLKWRLQSKMNMNIEHHVDTLYYKELFKLWKFIGCRFLEERVLCSGRGWQGINKTATLKEIDLIQTALKCNLFPSAGCGFQQWPLLWGSWERWTFPHPGKWTPQYCIGVLSYISSCRVFQRNWRSWSLRMWWWWALQPTWPSMCSGTPRRRIK